ncbi:MAG: alpha amylase C-terminal domain-containing protein [Actinomycetota bacterium]|nr:alpha amylase C-terminal domain-containing protein [Actinomycetota bacterium]MDQ6946610.1 alpha amylase C-terminal domain-containing protein [Actinomycetota bacterium]
MDWHLLSYPEHRGMQDLVRELNRCYRAEAASCEIDFESDGFRWIDTSDTESNVLSFLRLSRGRPGRGLHRQPVPGPRPGYRVGLPRPGRWREVLNTDAARFASRGTDDAASVLTDGGSGMGRISRPRSTFHRWA